MKKLFVYIVLVTWLFAMMDWQVIQYTRLTHPELTEWMHQHEQAYARIKNILRYAVCPPCAALEPVFYSAIKHAEASEIQQAAITHAPEPSWSGFYHLVKRGESWTFVPWSAWFLYWLPYTIIWRYAWKVVYDVIRTTEIRMVERTHTHRRKAVGTLRV